VTTADDGSTTVIAKPDGGGAENQSGSVRSRLTRLSRIGGNANRPLRIAGLFIVFLLLCAPFLKNQIDRHYPLSPIDERTYADYLYKVHNGHWVVRHGEPNSGWTLREAACRGVPPLQPTNPAACAEVSPKDGGINTADIDPPTYYILTDFGARIALRTGLAKDLITAGRYTGVFWCAGSMLGVFLLARYLGANRIGSLIAAFLVATAPYTLDQFRFITPHGTDLVIGALVAYLVLAWDRGERGPWALVVAGAIGPLVKASDVVIAVAMVCYLLLGACWPRGSVDRAIARRRMIGAGIVTAALGVASVAWLIVRTVLTVSNRKAFTAFDVNRLHSRFFTETFATFLRPVGFSSLVGASMLLTVFVIASAFHYAMYDREPFVLRRLATSYLLLAIFGPWMLVLSTYFLTHQYVPAPGRYGTSLIPLSLALGAVMLGNRRVALAAAAVLVVASAYFLRPA
jgi:hypothetical protein